MTEKAGYGAQIDKIRAVLCINGERLLNVLNIYAETLEKAAVI